MKKGGTNLRMKPSSSGLEEMMLEDIAHKWLSKFAKLGFSYKYELFVLDIVYYKRWRSWLEETFTWTCICKFHFCESINVLQICAVLRLGSC